MPQASTNSCREGGYNLENRGFWFDVYLLIFCGERNSDLRLLNYSLHLLNFQNFLAYFLQNFLESFLLKEVTFAD